MFHCEAKANLFFSHVNFLVSTVLSWGTNESHKSMVGSRLHAFWAILRLSRRQGRAVEKEVFVDGPRAWLIGGPGTNHIQKPWETHSDNLLGILWYFSCCRRICNRFPFTCWSSSFDLLRPMRSYSPCTIQRHCLRPTKGSYWKIKVFRGNSHPNELINSCIDGFLGLEGLGPWQSSIGVSWRGHTLRVPPRRTPLCCSWMLDGEQNLTHTKAMRGNDWVWIWIKGALPFSFADSSIQYRVGVELSACRKLYDSTKIVCGLGGISPSIPMKHTNHAMPVVQANKIIISPFCYTIVRYDVVRFATSTVCCRMMRLNSTNVDSFICSLQVVTKREIPRGFGSSVCAGHFGSVANFGTWDMFCFNSGNSQVALKETFLTIMTPSNLSLAFPGFPSTHWQLKSSQPVNSYPLKLNIRKAIPLFNGGNHSEPPTPMELLKDGQYHPGGVCHASS